MAYSWTPALSVGVEQIDAQHKELFERLNALIAAASQGKGKEELGAVLRFLNEYVVRHFIDEEKLQRSSNYPDCLPHKEEHTRFMEDMERLGREFAQHGATSVGVIAVQRRAGDWLVNHIHKSDRKLADYLRSSAVVSQGAVSR